MALATTMETAAAATPHRGPRERDDGRQESPEERLRSRKLLWLKRVAASDREDDRDEEEGEEEEGKEEEEEEEEEKEEGKEEERGNGTTGRTMARSHQGKAITHKRSAMEAATSATAATSGKKRMRVGGVKSAASSSEAVVEEGRRTTAEEEMEEDEDEEEGTEEMEDRPAHHDCQHRHRRPPLAPPHSHDRKCCREPRDKGHTRRGDNATPPPPSPPGTLSAMASDFLLHQTCALLKQQSLEYEVRGRELEEELAGVVAEREAYEKKLRSLQRRLAAVATTPSSTTVIATATSSSSCSSTATNTPMATTLMTNAMSAPSEEETPMAAAVAPSRQSIDSLLPASIAQKEAAIQRALRERRDAIRRELEEIERLASSPPRQR